MNFKLKFDDWYKPWPMKKIMGFMKEDKEYILEIKIAKEKRSLSQNQYYWGTIIQLLSEATGYTKNEAHQILASLNLSYTKELKDGSSRLFAKSTTELNTKEFEDYCEQCRLFIWHEFQITIPKPNELTEEQLLLLEQLNRY